MARNVALVAFGIVVGVLGGAAFGIHAAGDGGMGAGSDQTGVDGSDQGDVETPELVVPDLTAGTPRIQQSYVIWDRLAQCESGGNWASIANPKYKGGLQMDAMFWSNHGGLAYAAAPQFATRVQQIQVAINGRDGLIGTAQGWGAWPVCSRRLGLR